LGSKSKKLVLKRFFTELIDWFYEFYDTELFRGADIQSKIEGLEELNQSLRQRNKIKDDAISQLSDQLMALTTRMQEIEKTTSIDIRLDSLSSLKYYLTIGMKHETKDTLPMYSTFIDIL